MDRWMHAAGYAALIVVLSAGAAQSLSGSNTVFSDDIADGQVRYADVRDGAMTGRKILNNSITGADVNEASLQLPKVHYARVAQNGVSVSGEASSVEHASEGIYVVRFRFNVDSCGVVGSAGGGPFDPAYANVTASITSSSSVRVYTSASNTLLDYPFHLVVVCR